MSIAAIDNAPLGGFHRRLTWACAGGPFLDGYLVSLIGIVLVGMSKDLNLTTLDQSLIGASLLVGMFFGGIFFGRLTDKLGRETMYKLDLLVMVGASIFSIFVTEAWQMVVLRFIIGVAIGADYPIATSLLAEWTPNKHRGKLLGLLIVSINIGAAAAPVVGYVLTDAFGPESWRWMIATSVVVGVVTLLLRRGTPESAVYLVNQGKPKEAQKSIQRALGITVPLEELQTAVDAEQSVKTGRFPDLFKGIYLRRTLLCGIFYMCQLIPMFGIYIFGPTILGAFGLSDGNLGNLGTAVISIVFAVGSVPAVMLVDRIGRRKLIIWSFALMTLPLAILGGGAAIPIWLVMVCFCAYAAFSGGAIVMEWIYPNELFPTSIRATAGGVATAISRIGAAAGTFLLPVSMAGLGLGPTMLIAAGITLVGLIVCVAWAEETLGMSLTQSSGATVNMAGPRGEARKLDPAPNREG